MNPVNYVGEALRAAARSIRYLAIKQAAERRQIVTDLQAICSRCDDAYAAVLKRLRPVKKGFGDRERLAEALGEFAADDETRKAFKPEHLCGEVDQLLQRLISHADWTRYAIDARRITQFRLALEQMRSLDGMLWDYYDDHAREMDRIAQQLARTRSPTKTAERLSYAEHVVSEFEHDIQDALKQIRLAKKDAHEAM